MVVIAILALFFASLFAACCLLLAAFIGSLLYMVVLHHRLQKKGLSREQTLLATPLPPDSQLPHVVVQIPSFNEGPVLRRGVEAAARLDWPRDKLHIQVLDDSTDETAELARTVVAELQAQGLDVVALQRTDRSGFKGGALHEAMQKTPYDYFAIFDVDYVPPTDFLRTCMRPFFANPNWAFVQARFDFLNPHENALTEMQMVTLDAHLGIEQATRCWAGHPLPFNGTCGIWQRAAIEAGGGWKGDTVTEDLDLTYRGWVKGWRALFLTSVAVPGELPADTKTWLRQQQRWQDGFRHVSLRMVPAILKSRDITPSAKAAALLHRRPGERGPQPGQGPPAGSHRLPVERPQVAEHEGAVAAGRVAVDPIDSVLPHRGRDAEQDDLSRAALVGVHSGNGVSHLTSVDLVFLNRAVSEVGLFARSEDYVLVHRATTAT